MYVVIEVVRIVPVRIQDDVRITFKEFAYGYAIRWIPKQQFGDGSKDLFGIELELNIFGRVYGGPEITLKSNPSIEAI